MELLIFGLVLVLLILFNVPIAFALGISSLYYLFAGEMPAMMAAQRLFSGAASFSLIALPLFMLTGFTMNHTGISIKLISFASALVGHIRGGLALVNIVVSMFFAGISGLSTADTAAVGSILIPGMKSKGYSSEYSAAVTAASSTMGIIIPPSIPMIIHGIAAGVSIRSLFIAGIIPGILIGVLQMFAAYAIAKKKGFPVEKQFAWKELLVSFAHASPGLLLPVIIIGGIIFGIFTPTEAGGVASFLALLLGFIYKGKEFFKLIGKIFSDTIIMSSVVMILISTSTIMSWVLTYEGVPMKVTQWVMGLSDNPLLMLIILAFLIIVLGMVFHGAPIQLIVVPMLLPLVANLGINPIVFGIVVIITVGIGQLSPPIGSALFVASAIAKTDIFKTTMANIPFLIIMFIVLFLVIFFPGVVLVFVP